MPKYNFLHDIIKTTKRCQKLVIFSHHKNEAIRWLTVGHLSSISHLFVNYILSKDIFITIYSSFSRLSDDLVLSGILYSDVLMSRVNRTYNECVQPVKQIILEFS